MSIQRTAADLLADERVANLSVELTAELARRAAELRLARSEQVEEACQALVEQVEVAGEELKRLQGDL